MGLGLTTQWEGERGREQGREGGREGGSKGGSKEGREEGREGKERQEGWGYMKTK